MYPYIFFISQSTCVLFLRSGTKLSANSRSLRTGVKKGLLHKNIYVYISVFGYNLIFICQFISTFPVIILRFFTKPFLFYRMYLHKSIISIKKRNKKRQHHTFIGLQTAYKNVYDIVLFFRAQCYFIAIYSMLYYDQPLTVFVKARRRALVVSSAAHNLSAHVTIQLSRNFGGVMLSGNICFRMISRSMKFKLKSRLALCKARSA